MTGLVNLWWEWMAAMLWQASLLVLIIAVIDLAIRRRVWPQVRYGLWLLVLVKLVMPPWWTVPWAPVAAAGDRLAAGITVSDAGTRVAGADGPAAATEHAESARTDRRPVTGSAEDGARRWIVSHHRVPTGWRTAAFAVWLAGVLALSVVFVVRLHRLARWHREQESRPTIPQWFHDRLIATSQRLGLERVPAIVFSEQAVTPAVYGLFRPVLLLPAHYTESLSRHEAEHVLLHEMAHLKRGDLPVHALFQVLQVLYWFNPLVAVANRQLKHVREICCDLTVAGVLREDTMAYRRTLIDTARQLLSESPQPGMGLVGVFEEPFKVIARMRWLERPTWQHRRMMTAAAWLVAMLAAPVLLPMAAVDSGLQASNRLPPPQSRPNTTAPDRANVEAGGSEPTEHTYVRSVFTVDRLVLGFAVSSNQTAVSETWVGPDIISVSERRRTVIYDRTRGWLTLIDHQTETWVETPLPLEIDAVLGDDLKRRRRGIRTTGKVEVTGRHRRILDRRCEEFRVTSWSSRGGALTDPNTFSVWTAVDPPFDRTLLDEVLLNLRLLYNRDQAYRNELEKMPGLQMRLELRDGSFFAGTRWADEVVEISSRVPPPGTYQPPAGYRQLERFEELEF
jgi:beta-lactamase regulating signal transducer with metallopeptidase domain